MSLRSNSYRPGKINVDADLLSRICIDEDNEPWKKLSQGDVRAICGHARVLGPADSEVRVADRLGIPAEGVPELYAFATHLNLGNLEQFTREDLRKAQLKDSVLKVVREAMNTGQWPTNLSQTDPEVGLLIRESQKFNVEDGLVYRITHQASGK